MGDYPRAFVCANRGKAGACHGIVREIQDKCRLPDTPDLFWQFEYVCRDCRDFASTVHKVMPNEKWR